MGMFSKLFKRPGNTKGPVRPLVGPSVEVEVKPAAVDPGADVGDQAARLRAAVASAQVESRTHEPAGSDAAPVHESDGLPESAPQDVSGATDEDLGLDDSRVVVPESATERAALAKKERPPRSKQELIEELHRNYREVLGLVRKLDTHLDDNEGRSQVVAAIARRYEELAPTIDSLPGEIRSAAESINTDLKAAITEQAGATRELLDRIESAIVHVGTDIERSINQPGQLVQTMAEFRQSLIDLSRSSTAACEAVRDFEQRALARDEAMLSQMRQTRYWLMGLTVVGSAIGIAGLVLGYLAISG